MAELDNTTGSQIEIERIRDGVESMRDSINGTIISAADQWPSRWIIDAVSESLRDYIQDIREYLPDELVFSTEKGADVLLDTNNLSVYLAVDLSDGRKRYLTNQSKLFSDREEILQAVERVLIGR